MSIDGTITFKHEKEAISETASKMKSALNKWFFKKPTWFTYQILKLFLLFEYKSNFQISTSAIFNTDRLF